MSTAPALAAQQQALLAALWAPGQAAAQALLAAHVQYAGGAPWQRGLLAYRSHGRLLAQRALAGAYPVLAQMLDEENFGALARAFWQAHAPAAGDIALWGEALPGFIESLPALAHEEPHLADVARLEWAFHRAATAADAEPDIPSLALLAERDPARVRLQLTPGTSMHTSAWPVASIVNAHLLGEPTLREAGQRLHDRVGEAALVWRRGYKPCVREALAGEADFVRALLAGHTLQAALDAAPALDFAAWLPLAVHSGLLVAARAD